MPRDAVSRTANVERNGGHKWVNQVDERDQTPRHLVHAVLDQLLMSNLKFIRLLY